MDWWHRELQVVQVQGCQAETVDLDTPHVQIHFSRDLLPDSVHNAPD